MIIVKLRGELGNQMFQYAAARRLAHKHNTLLKMDISRYKKDPLREYQLHHLNVIEDFAQAKDIERILYGECSYLKKLFFKLKPPDYKKIPHYVTDEQFTFDKRVLELPCHAVLDGHWQSEKYFEDIKGLIRQEFTCKSTLGPEAGSLAQFIRSVNAVCVNVRRRDFVTFPEDAHVLGAQGADYFKRAIDVIQSKITNPYYFVFSDNLPWCREHLKLPKANMLVTHNYAGEDFRDYLSLMRACRHFIIPNSTFGWWAAWLSDFAEKVIVAPRKWFVVDDYDTRDLIPTEWERI